MIYGSPVGQVFTSILHVGVKPTLIACSQRVRKGRTSIEIYVPFSPDSAAVYLGDNYVSAEIGIPIRNDTSRIIPVNTDSRIYLVADMPTDVVIAEYTP